MNPFSSLPHFVQLFCLFVESAKRTNLFGKFYQKFAPIKLCQCRELKRSRLIYTARISCICFPTSSRVITADTMKTLTTSHPDVLSAPRPVDNLESLYRTECPEKMASHSDSVHRRTGENRMIVWLLLAAPLALHFLVVIILTIAIKFYIGGHDFNLQFRRSFARFSPLQSDITTAVSSGVTISRIFAAMWSTSTAWRCVFILMEKGGIFLEQINRLLTWQFYYDGRPTSSRKASLLISIILFASFPSQLSGPILTGSITWTPSHRFLEGQPINISTSYTIDWSTYNFSDPTFHLSHDYFNKVAYSAEVSTASNLVPIAWPRQGSQDDEGTMKRVTSTVAHLPINSTLKNVTLPYFAVTNLEWIKDPWNELPQTLILSVQNLSFYNPFYRRDVGPAFAMIPHNWSSPTPPPVPFTGTVMETRLLTGVYSDSNDGFPCNAQSPFGEISKGMGFANITTTFSTESRIDACYIFAWITYVAGAAMCTDCRVASWLTVQNDTSLTVLPDMMTMDALGMMPLVAKLMTEKNVSIPKACNNLDGYVSGLLARSYAAAWTFLMDEYVDKYPGREMVETEVQVAVSTSKANVSSGRVLLWLLLNLMFTLSGLLFLFLQSRCSQPVIVDASMAALLLDTSDVLHMRNRALCNFSRLVKDDKNIGYLELRQTCEGGHRRVVVFESERRMIVL